MAWSHEKMRLSAWNQSPVQLLLCMVKLEHSYPFVLYVLWCGWGLPCSCAKWRESRPKMAKKVHGIRCMVYPPCSGFPTLQSWPRDFDSSPTWNQLILVNLSKSQKFFIVFLGVCSQVSLMYLLWSLQCSKCFFARLSSTVHLKNIIENLLPQPSILQHFLPP